MKKVNKIAGYSLLAACLFLSSCKKDSAKENTSEFQVQSDDQSRFNNETDAATNDAVTALENIGGSYNGETPIAPLLPSVCDATISVDTTSTPRKITVTYNGTNCIGNRTRTGTVVIAFAPSFRWYQAGANFSVTYQNLKITRISDNQSITLNGTKVITNVSGGRLRNLATSGTSIVHEVRSSGMDVTFDDGTVRSWQLARRRTFTYNNGIVASVEGIGAQGGGVAEWGTTRYGLSFTSAILQPLVFKQSCNFKLVSGQIQHTRANANSVITFGLDVAGNTVSTCPSGSFYYKLVWTNAAGVSFTYIAPY